MLKLGPFIRGFSPALIGAPASGRWDWSPDKSAFEPNTELSKNPHGIRMKNLNLINQVVSKYVDGELTINDDSQIHVTTK